MWRARHRLRVIAVVIVANGVVVAAGAASGASAAVAAGGRRPTGIVLPARAAPRTRTCYSPRQSPCAVPNRIWAGYAVTPLYHDFTSVQASWVVTRVTCPKPDAWTVFWVGLDGWINGFSDNVEQGGVSAQCQSTGTGRAQPVYEAWWEMYPYNNITPVPFTPPIAVGDRVTASVAYVAGSFVPEVSAAQYAISVTDDTTGQSFTEDATCGNTGSAIYDDPCQDLSAEWVIEAPSGYNGSNSSQYPLARFRTVTFTGATVVDDNGDSGPIADPNWSYTGIDMESQTSTRGYQASVAGLQNYGSTFRIVWK